LPIRPGVEYRHTVQHVSERTGWALPPRLARANAVGSARGVSKPECSKISSGAGTA
jgi:hypothetical protein